MGTNIAGVPGNEWSHLKKLSRRPLMAQDIPNAVWKPEYAEYRLRDDGAIISDGMCIELGWLDGRGGVNWLG